MLLLPSVVCSVLGGPHVLWSRGWQNMVECPSVPKSYYAAGTEDTHSALQMKRYFSNCSGLLWIRLSSGPSCDTVTFIEHVLPHLATPITLVTTDGDNSVPSQIRSASRLLDHPLLERWYTQNYDGSTKHAKLRPFPIGFDLHTVRPGRHGPVVGLTGLQHARVASVAPTRRTPGILFDGMAMNAHRQNADHKLHCTEHRHENRMPVDAVWERYGTYMFGVSPHGNGLDSHRTWEMLYLGMVPIVKSSSLDPLYNGLPVLIVKEWDDVCNHNVQRTHKLFHAMLPVKENVFTLERWLSA